MPQQLRPSYLELFKQFTTDIESGYDLLAPKFEQSNYFTPQELIKPVFNKLKAEGYEFDSGIDICCGTGMASYELAQNCKKEYTGLDISKGMLEQCENKLKKITHLKKVFLKGDALDLPFENEFELAVSFGAFGHILEKDKKLFVQQIHKVLKKDGVFCFITTYKPSYTQWIYWDQLIFNGLMKARNLLLSPKFIMYYLTFRMPEVQSLLEQEGFSVKVYDNIFGSEKIAGYKYLIPAKEFVMIKATKL